MEEQQGGDIAKGTVDERKKLALQCMDFITLLKWAKPNGLYFGKLCPAMFTQTGRGLMTNKSLIRGNIVISVPENMLITLKTANESKNWKTTV